MSQLSIPLALMLSLLTTAHLYGDDAAIRVMSFNIRYGTAKDGENHWEHRSEFVIETIRMSNPDLLGTQETLDFQRDEIAAGLSEYATFGVGRDDGKEQGEMMSIFYKKNRFEQLDGGHFWYSETPETPGTKAWDSSLPRMASWLKLKDKQTDQVLFFFNTHFDHRGAEARRQSALLLRKKAQSIAGDVPVVIIGDFNATIDSDVYQNLFRTGKGKLSLIDTFGHKHPKQRTGIGTAGGFTLMARGNRRIDWIACTPHFKVLSAKINKANQNGRTPSDHDPVEAELLLD